MKIKVLAISHMYPSDFNRIFGIYVQELIKKLVQQNCEVKVVSPVPKMPFLVKYFKNKWKNYSKIPLKTVCEEAKIYHPRYLEFPKNLFFSSSGKRMYTGIEKLVDEIYENFKFDIVHAHFLFPDGYTGMKIAQKYKKPLIVTIYGSDILIFPYRSKKSFNNTAEILKESSKIIAFGENIENKCLEEFNISKEKIKVLYNGYDPGKFDFNKSKRKREKENIKILFVGNMLETKGIFDLLKAITIIREQNYKLFKKILWTFIGDGDDIKKLKKQIQKYHLQNNVKIVGRIPHQETAQYMNNSDFIILPSWSEGVPTVLVEAMACGLPVIATTVGEIPKMVNQNTGILVQPKAPIDLANGIISATSKKWDNKLINDSVKDWTWDKNAQKNIEIYKEVLNYGKEKNLHFDFGSSRF